MPGWRNRASGECRPPSAQRPARPPRPSAATRPGELNANALPSFALPSRRQSFVEPDVFHAPAAEDVVHHDCQPLDIWLLAGPARGVEDNWPDAVLRQFALDCPQQLLAPPDIALVRLLFDQLVHLGIAITVPVQVRATAVKQLDSWIGVGPAGLQVERDGIVLALDFWKVLRSVDQFEFAVDVHALQLVDQQYGRISVDRPLARRDLDH